MAWHSSRGLSAGLVQDSPELAADPCCDLPAASPRPSHILLPSPQVPHGSPGTRALYILLSESSQAHVAGTGAFSCC